MIAVDRVRAADHKITLITKTNELPQYTFIGLNSIGLEHDQIVCSCSVAYFGNDTTVIKMRNVRENEVLETSCNETDRSTNISPTRLTCNVTMNANLHLDGAQIICETNKSAKTQHNYTTEPLKK